MTDHSPDAAQLDAAHLDALAPRAEAGDGAAAFELGKLCREGEHVPLDFRAALYPAAVANIPSCGSTQTGMDTGCSGLGPCEEEPMTSRQHSASMVN